MCFFIHGGGYLVEPRTWYAVLTPKESVLVTPISIGGLRAFGQGVRSTHKDEPYVHLWVLLLDQQMLGTVARKESTLGLQHNTIIKNEVRSVMVLFEIADTFGLVAEADPRTF